MTKIKKYFSMDTIDADANKDLEEKE